MRSDAILRPRPVRPRVRSRRTRQADRNARRGRGSPRNRPATAAATASGTAQRATVRESSANAIVEPLADARPRLLGQRSPQCLDEREPRGARRRALGEGDGRGLAFRRDGVGEPAGDDLAPVAGRVRLPRMPASQPASSRAGRPSATTSTRRHQSGPSRPRPFRRQVGARGPRRELDLLGPIPGRRLIGDGPAECDEPVEPAVVPGREPGRPGGGGKPSAEVAPRRSRSARDPAGDRRPTTRTARTAARPRRSSGRRRSPA